MNKSLASLFIVLLILAAPFCWAQTRIAISYPDMEQEEQVVHISYHITDSDPSDRFLVSVVVTDQKGDRLNAQSLSGDVGHNVSGGGVKQIAWDAGADSITIDEIIDIRILVEAISPTKQELMALEEAQRIQDLSDEMARANALTMNSQGSPVLPEAKIKTYTRTGLVFQSLVFPGWGLSRLERKPHWIKGLAAYSCVAGSIVLNRKAVETYGRIDDVEDFEGKDQLFQEAVMQDNLSEIMAYGAVGIWVADFIWTLVGTRHVSGVNVISSIDPITYAPMLGFTYKF